MTAEVRRKFNKVFTELQRLGLLLSSDSFFPNVTRMVSGRDIVGSWWSDESAHTIFAVSEMLADHSDVLVMKFLHGKVTYVHRELWGQVYSIGLARDDWQLQKLSPAAKSMLKLLDKEGTIQTDKLRKSLGPRPGDIARELESRLLVHAEQVHTESGKHAKLLESWECWAKRVGYRARAQNSVAARRYLEERVAGIQRSTRNVFPWPAELK